MDYLRRAPPPPRMLPAPRALLDLALDPLNPPDPPPNALRLLILELLRDISRVPTRLALLEILLRLAPEELIPDARLLTLGAAEPVRLPNELFPNPEELLPKPDDGRWLGRFPP
jgi:hypothetical protein